MPRGRKPKPIRQTQSEQLTAFAGRIEQATTRWLDDYEARRVSLMAAFDELNRRVTEKAETEDLVKLTAQLAAVHQRLTASESDMLKFAAIREQNLQAKGLSHFAERSGGTHNTLNINYAPNLSTEQREQMERLFLASVSGKEVEAVPVKTIEAQVA